MLCPCGQHELSPRDFRAWLEHTQEARMQARMVVKAEQFGGRGMRKVVKDGRACLEVAGEYDDGPAVPRIE